MALDNFRKVNITLHKANQRVLETQIAKVGDANGRELVVQITNDGVIEDQTGTTLKLNWQHENGNQGSTNFNVLDIKTGRFSVFYPKEMLYKGKVNASIEISSNGKITNSMNFKIIVQADVFDGEAGTVDGVFISLAEVNKKLDDREAEYVELKSRQSTVENQFNDIKQEMTEKDVISAPEIIEARGSDATLGERLNKNEIKMNDIAINPRDFGAMLNGVSDDTQSLKQSLLHASLTGSEVLLSGIISVSEKIEIPEGVTINSYNAVIKPTINTDVLEFNRNTSMKGNLVIDVRDIGAEFTSDAIRFDGTKRLSYRDISLDRVFIYGSTTYGKGNAIHFECLTPQSDISFVKFNEVIIRGFETGIFMDAPFNPLANNYNYINGNLFNNLIISDCDYYIFGTGSGTSTAQVGGNIFSNVQLQYNNRAKEMIHLEGNGNIINGYLWDVSGKDCLAVNLTKTSINNVINTEGSLTATYVDEGNYNEINALNQHYDVVPVRALQSSNIRFRYEGDYQNILHKADALHSVSVLEGAETRLGGNLGNIFDSMRGDDLRLDLSEEKLYSFEILFDASKYVGYLVSYLQGGLNALGFTFSYESVPKTIRVEVTDRNGVTRNSEIDMQYQKNRPYVRLTRNSVNGLASDIQKIKITLVGQFSDDVRLASVYANSPNISGNKYISNAGGRVVGDLIFENQSRAVVLSSPNGSKYRLKIDDAGTLTTDKL